MNKCYPDRMDFVDSVLKDTDAILTKLGVQQIDYNSVLSREMTKLMKMPVEIFNDILTVLELKHYRPLIDHFDYLGIIVCFIVFLIIFPFIGRKNLAVYTVNNVLENETFIQTPESVDLVLSILTPLIQDQPDQPAIEEDPEDFDEEQGLLGR